MTVGLPWAALLVLLIAAGNRAQAQWDTLFLPFRSLTIEDGLSQGMVSSIIQDRAGFMWFATKDGLNRYDGYSFRVFRHDPADSTTVRDLRLAPLASREALVTMPWRKAEKMPRSRGALLPRSSALTISRIMAAL